jgi:hypothetical protein
VGSADSGLIVCTPEAMLNWIVSATPTLAFESMMACRSDPGPESAVLVTRRVESNDRAPSHSTWNWAGPRQAIFRGRRWLETLRFIAVVPQNS